MSFTIENNMCEVGDYTVEITLVCLMATCVGYEVFNVLNNLFDIASSMFISYIVDFLIDLLVVTVLILDFIFTLCEYIYEALCCILFISWIITVYGSLLYCLFLMSSFVYHQYV